MVIYDPVAGMLSSIQIGYNKNLISVKCRKSNFIIQILDVMYKEGYIAGYRYLHENKMNSIMFNIKKKFYYIEHNSNELIELNDQFKNIFSKFKFYNNLNPDPFTIKHYTRMELRKFKKIYSIKLIKFKKLKLNYIQKLKKNKFKNFQTKYKILLKQKKISHFKQKDLFNKNFKTKYFKSDFKYRFTTKWIIHKYLKNQNNIITKFKSNQYVHTLEIRKNKIFIDPVFNSFKCQKIEIFLKYNQNLPVIKRIKKISKLSRRVYLPINKLTNTNSFSTYILSTPKGILSNNQAKILNVGGEILIKVN